jgi:hypothetical protein
VAWAGRILPIKNSLISEEALAIEQAFAARMAAFEPEPPNTTGHPAGAQSEPTRSRTRAPTAKDPVGCGRNDIWSTLPRRFATELPRMPITFDLPNRERLDARSATSSRSRYVASITARFTAEARRPLGGLSSRSILFRSPRRSGRRRGTLAKDDRCEAGCAGAGDSPVRSASADDFTVPLVASITRFTIEAMKRLGKLIVARPASF